MVESNLQKVSLGMPVYNGENYLAQAIESVLKQTYSNWELIIVDNCSTDATSKISLNYSQLDSRIQYIKNPTNIGAAPNFRKALTLATGTYFKWIAHDDLYHENWIQVCVEALNKDPQIVLAYTKTIIIDDAGKKLQSYSDAFTCNQKNAFQRFKDILIHLGYCHAIFGLMRTSVIKNLAPIGNYQASDAVYLAEITLHGHYCQLDFEYFFRRKHNKSSSESISTAEDWAKWFDPLNPKKLHLTRWDMLRGYWRAVNGAPLSLLEKIQCKVYLLQRVRWHWPLYQAEISQYMRYLKYKYLPFYSKPRMSQK